MIFACILSDRLRLIKPTKRGCPISNASTLVLANTTWLFMNSHYEIQQDMEQQLYMDDLGKT
jgi:hypothetical protein